MFYTYAFLREDGTPYYIGKGSGNRCYVKCGRNVGMPPRERIIKLKENLTEEDAFRHEVYLIAILPNLHNLTDGGEGASGHKKTDEEKKALSERMKNNNPMFNPEVRERMRLSQTGKKQSQETIDKRLETIRNNGGVKLTEEQREKISRGNRGKPKSEAHKQAMRAAWVRRKKRMDT